METMHLVSARPGAEYPLGMRPVAPAAPGRFRVGFCSRLGDNPKSLECLLTGFADFARQVPEADLWSIGDDLGQVPVNCRAGFGQLQGSGPGASSLLRELHVFAYPVPAEGSFPAVLEAVALGIPSIGIEATGLGWRGRQPSCGEVLSTANPALLLQALRRLHHLWQAANESDAVAARCRQIVGATPHWPVLLPAPGQPYPRALAA